MTLAEINDELGVARTKKEFFRKNRRHHTMRKIFENYRAVRTPCVAAIRS